MQPDSHALNAILTSNENLSDCTPIELTKIIPYTEIISIKAGDTLYTQGSPADSVFIVLKGSIELRHDGKTVDTATPGFIGEDRISSGNNYIADAVASTDSEVLAIQWEHFAALLESCPALEDSFTRSFYSHYSFGIIPKEPAKKAGAVEEKRKIPVSMVIGWVLTLLMPVGVYLLTEHYDLEWKTRIFLTLFTPIILMWIFRLAHEFIPSILAVLGILILDIAPPSVALSGFADGSFFMALSVFGISAVLIMSGLSYRIVINILRFVPQSQFWYSLTLILTGIILSPLIPTANGRIAIAAPIYLDLAKELGYRPGGRAATRLGIATFSGFTLFSAIFLSSKSIHFVIWGLLPFQVREQFNWGYWLFASLIAGAVLLVGQLALENLFFKRDEKPRLSREMIEAQRKMLGKLTMYEWSAMGGILLFLLGIVTQSIHKIDLSWVALTVLYIILALEFLDKKEFQYRIDWSFLIYLATLIGLVKSMSFIGLDAKIGEHLAWLGNYVNANFLLFILMLSVSIMVLRLFIPNNATVAILASVFLPIAEISGINAWVIGFVILIMSDAWFMPYQCTYYTQFEELTTKKNMYNKKTMLIFNAATVLLRLAAIYASIPFWRSIGII